VNLGDIYFQINDYENYCDCYTKASLNVPQDLAERKQYIETNVSKYCDSKNMPYYFVRALSKYVDANYGECISIAETGLGVVGTSATLSNLKGTANLARGEYEMASLEFLNCLNNKDMLVSEVINYYSTKISAPDAKLVADSYIVKSDLGLAEVFLYLKDPENALLSVNNAIKLADSMSRFEEIEILYNLRAFTYLAKNDVTTAKKEFEFALVKNPNSNYTKLNQALLILLSACKTTPKQYKFIYVAEYHAVRMIMPKLKPLKDQETKLNEALQICNTIIENDPTNAYAYLLKSKISQLLGDVNYCSYAKLAKENGIFNAFEELGISCK
jgi:tetratricopeptide (TPR) repeat protein